MMMMMLLMMFRDILVTILLVYWYTGYNSTGILVYWLQLDCTNQYKLITARKQ